jgi:hypothetical protein
MQKNLKGICLKDMSKGKHLINKAIEYYKDAFVDFHNLNSHLRYDSFIIKLHIAYTCLFMQIYKNHAEKTVFNKELKGEELSLTRLLNQMQSYDNDWNKVNNNSFYRNLEYLIKRRNTIEHYNDTVLELFDDERRVFNATFRNFHFCITKYFAEKANKMPLVTQLFSYLEENQLKTTGNKKQDTKFLKDFIKQHKVINPSFYYPESNIAKIFVVYDNNMKKNYPDAMKGCIEHVYPENAEVFIQSIIKSTHKYNSEYICDEVNKQIGTKKLISKGRYSNFRSTLEQYCVYGNNKYHYEETTMRKNRTTNEMYEDKRDKFTKILVDFLCLKLQQ